MNAGSIEQFLRDVWRTFTCWCVVVVVASIPYYFFDPGHLHKIFESSWWAFIPLYIGAVRDRQKREGKAREDARRVAG